MLAHDLFFLIAQCARFLQDVVGYAYLANIMQQGSCYERIQPILGEAHVDTNMMRRPGDSPQVVTERRRVYLRRRHDRQTRLPAVHTVGDGEPYRGRRGNSLFRGYLLSHMPYCERNFAGSVLGGFLPQPTRYP